MARRRLLSLVAVLLCFGAGAARAPAQGLSTGFSADPALTGGTSAAATIWIPHAVAEGASIVRVNVVWSQVAPTVRPASFAPADPSSPGYDWSTVDAAVRGLASN